MSAINDGRFPLHFILNVPSLQSKHGVGSITLLVCLFSAGQGVEKSFTYNNINNPKHITVVKTEWLKVKRIHVLKG